MESNQIKRKKSKERCADDVKRLVSTIENGVPAIKLKGELLRLRNLILDNQLQDFIIEECGKDSLLFILETAQKFRKYKNKKEDENAPLGADKDRKDWLRWFRKTYGMDGEHPMSEEWYRVIWAAALNVNFSELKAKSKSKAVFYLNGFSECCRIANIENYHEPPKKKRNGYYSQGSYSQDTRKEWGSVFKPARG